jgi:octaprenyl-diphosphate synthase
MLVSDRNDFAEAIPQVMRTWQEIVGPVQPFLQKVAVTLRQQVNAFEPEITPYAEYALANQGKQIRPALVALSGKAVGQLNDALVRVAVIIEMVHLATLVHDDVMDEASIRRSRPTLARNWGNEISVLVGDCLFAHALTLAASFPTPDVCRAVAMATNVVCSGEIIQTTQRGKTTLKRDNYFKAVEMKTCELFALSCELGGALAGASASEKHALRRFGLVLGTAYQIYDDCLDLFSTEAIAGKTLGTDLASGKVTLPVLIILENGTSSDQILLQKAIESQKPGDNAIIFELLERYEALNQTKRVVYELIEQAQQTLAELKPSPGVDALAALGEFLAQQTRALGVQ